MILFLVLIIEHDIAICSVTTTDKTSFAFPKYHFLVSLKKASHYTSEAEDVHEEKQDTVSLLLQSCSLDPFGDSNKSLDQGLSRSFESHLGITGKFIGRGQ